MTTDLQKLQLLGLTEQKGVETLKNKDLTKKLLNVLDVALKVNSTISKKQGTLLYHIGTKLKAQLNNQLDFIIDYVMSDKINNEPQLNAAFDYLLDHATKQISIPEFEKFCGVGVNVTPEEIEEVVTSLFAEYKDEIMAQAYDFNTAKLLVKAREKLKWADGKNIKSEIDCQLFDLFGPRPSGDVKVKATNGPQEKAKNKMAPQKSATPATSHSEKTGVNSELTNNLTSNIDISKLDLSSKTNCFLNLMCGEASKFHKPGENWKTEGYVVTPKTDQLMKEHLKATGGKVVTRFPPEPNGILHIGHAKAINFNFGYAKANDGICYLRYDDTNPEKEEEKFFTAIKEMVEWLGYTPYKVTYASDHFDKLYNWAVELIKKDLAYVCHQKVEEIRGIETKESPWRNRPIEESLKLFDDMKKGKIAEGDATLRLKTTLEDGKRDPIAYRIKFVPHHRTGNDWCIYPSYDYTHCLCDSIENISHSLCTKEFQSRRSSYYWLVNALDLYCPVQWEYARLNLNYTVVSKRKILALISNGIVREWDDPRLFTLTALRRRGVPPEAINWFCSLAGVTMSQTVLDPSMFDSCIRDVLNKTAPRAMVVLDPLKVTFKNEIPASCNTGGQVKVPNFPTADPKTNSKETSNDSYHLVTLTGNVIYIDASDFMEDAPASFKRFAPKQPVGLRHANLILEFVKVLERCPTTNRPVHVEVIAKTISEETTKPKGFIQWVCRPIPVEVRLYERLFNEKNPEGCPGGTMAAVNKDSLHVIGNALVDSSMKNAKVYDHFQFERIGYFSVDIDSKPDHLVFNQTVSLREDPGKL